MGFVGVFPNFGVLDGDFFVDFFLEFGVLVDVVDFLLEV